MNSDDIKATTELLQKLEPGFLPYPIFSQIARLVVLPILEVIPLRLVEGRVEVLLIKREADDELWPGALHTPGTVIRATDTTNSQSLIPFARILHDELKDTPVGTPHYLGSIFHESKRGSEQAQLYWVEVTGEPKTGAFYDVDALPDDLIASQLDFISKAAISFRAGRA